MLNTGLVFKRKRRFDPKGGKKAIRSLPKFPPFAVLRIFALGLIAVLVTAFALFRQATLPKAQLFRPVSSADAGADDLIYIEVPLEPTK